MTYSKAVNAETGEESFEAKIKVSGICKGTCDKKEDSPLARESGLRDGLLRPSANHCLISISLKPDFVGNQCKMNWVSPRLLCLPLHGMLAFCKVMVNLKDLLPLPSSQSSSLGQVVCHRCR